MNDTDKPFIIAAKTDGNAFVPYAYATTREAALESHGEFASLNFPALRQLFNVTEEDV